MAKSVGDNTVNVEEVRPGLFCFEGKFKLNKPPNKDAANASFKSDSTNSNVNTTSTEILRVCHVDFVINGQSYILKVFFTQLNRNIMAGLELTRATLLSDPSPAKKAKTTRNANQMRIVDAELPFHVWATVKTIKTSSIVTATLNKINADIWTSSPLAYYEEKHFGCTFDRAMENKLKLAFWMDFGIPEWKANKKKLNQLNSLFTNQALCDVKFTFQRTKKETVGAHIAVLSAASPVFASIFKSDLKGTRDKILHIDDIETAVFKRLLSYMYDGQIGSFDNEDCIRQLLMAADKYGIKKLKEKCELRLQSLISIENVLDILVLAEKSSCPYLYRKAIEFAETRSQQICFLPSWKDLIFKHSGICFELTQRFATKPQLDCSVGLKTKPIITMK